MATLSAPAPSVPAAEVRTDRTAVSAFLLPGATVIALLAVALLLTMTPWSVHLLLDAAGTPHLMTAAPEETYRLSDETVDDLLFGGDFAITAPGGGPMYDASEIAHLQDARTLLYGFLALAIVSVLGIIAVARRSADGRSVWKGIARGGAALAIGVVVVGVVGFFAFEPAFELFHRVFFPGGNWSFDPATSRLVQLYPMSFWVATTAVFGGLALVLGVATWAVARKRGGSPR